MNLRSVPQVAVAFRLTAVLIISAILTGCAFADTAVDPTSTPAGFTPSTPVKEPTLEPLPSDPPVTLTTAPTAAPVDETAPPENGSPDPLAAQELPKLTAGQAVTITHIRMFDDQHGWALGGLLDPGERVLRTTDGGSSWQDVSPPSHIGLENIAAEAHFESALEAWALYFHPDESEGTIGGNISFGIWRTQDGGQSWKSGAALESEFIGNAFEHPHLWFVDSQFGWLMLRLGSVGTSRAPIYLFQTQDAGSTWNQLSDPYEGEYLQSCEKTSLRFSDADHGWVTIASCPRDLHIQASADGGASWEILILPPLLGDYAGTCWASIWSQRFTTDNGFVLVDCFREGSANGDRFLYRTTDVGENWLILPFPGQQAEFISPEIGWALGERVFRTLDGGRNWTDMGPISWIGQFSFIDQELGWAVARSNDGEVALVRTTDGGATWFIIETVIRGD